MEKLKDMKPNSLVITYLSKVSLASLNGSDKEVDNINPIKKITLDNGEEVPYVSSQAIRRALRDKLEELGYTLSPVDVPSASKGAPKTAMDPEKYIDDDLFGYMDAKAGEAGGKGSSNTRTSPVRVEALIALSPYKGDLDYGTNFMGKEIGVDPNIYETEIHSGVYRGTILIELDRVGKEWKLKDKKTKELEEVDLVDNKTKAERVLAFLKAFKHLWTSGRQTRYLADISPKFIAVAYMKSKNPVFLEAVNLNEEGQVDMNKLQSVLDDYNDIIEDYVFAVQEAVFNKNDKMVSLKEGFEKMEEWVKEYYNVKENSEENPEE